MIATQTCQRCGRATDSTIMSMFNTQVICLDCESNERQHSDYEKARSAELKAIKDGNYNFLGIGYPGPKR